MLTNRSKHEFIPPNQCNNNRLQLMKLIVNKLETSNIKKKQAGETKWKFQTF